MRFRKMLIAAVLFLFAASAIAVAKPKTKQGELCDFVPIKCGSTTQGGNGDGREPPKTK